ncbi:dicarboxylate/amino acid:cation symporter [Microbacterium allomyrinae]|uniref:L-cystine uptake protein TcyP n=1 Tax=Microbacterium allomyrinae TaxID=2830666 RepID=A0A9X1LYF6_9MICO|nr:dicarboxylate/amino acid:cation symporter [Microbacterium allomyrinae]MCC2034081.1 dicarboxylate/amino acid:cation symporter [Microbacterium allomyrinae]
MTETFDLLSAVSLVVTIAAFAGLVLLRVRRAGFTTLVLIALAVGIGIGILFRGHLTYVGFLGDVYVQVITAIVAPLIFVSILSSVTSLGSTAKLRTIGLSSTFWLLLTNAIAIVLTLAIVISLGVGTGVEFTTEDGSGDSLVGLVRPLDEVLLGLFPANLAGDFVSNNIVPIILFAILFSVAYLVANRRTDPQLAAFKNVVDGAKKVVMTAVGFIIELTPYAVLALVATTTATAVTRIETVLSLVGILVLAVGISFLDAYVVNGVLLRVFADVNPIRWFRHMTAAQYTAFTTQSSVGTLPITIPSLTRKVGVSEDVATFAAPVGTTIGMPGCAGIWPIIVAVFSINALGIEYSVWDYLALAGLCMLVSLGTAGVPGTAIITATAVLTAVGLPIEILVVLIPVSAIAGTASTMANVTAAATAATIVARRLGTLDDAVFRGDGDLGPAFPARSETRRDRRARAASAAGGTTGAAVSSAGTASDPSAAPTLLLGRPLAGAGTPVTDDALATERTERDAVTAVLSSAGITEYTIPDDIPIGQCELPGARLDDTARIS